MSAAATLLEPAPAPARTATGPPRRAVVVDAGVGNLGNLSRALTAVGAEVTVTRDPRVVAQARCLLLPGVGAFRPPREALRGALEEALATAVAGGGWLLGICVGYQLLFDSSEEHGATDGLGLLPGRVTRLPETVPLPHIGWNRLGELAEHPLTRGLAEGAHVYFVHSYAPEAVPAEAVLARTLHGRAFAAVAGGGRVFGTQFHPEKSDRVGLALLTNFLEMSHATAAGH
jgi:glutamine amidotransferase